MQAGLYHAPYYLRNYARLPCSAVTTLYDAIPRLFPREASLRARLLFNLLNRLALARSQQILAISASARADLVAGYGLHPARISVTPLAADPRFRPQPASAIAAVRARQGLPAHYLLTLSSNKPHKNLVGLIEAYALLLGQAPGPWPDLVIAGLWDARYPEALQATDRLGLAGRVRFENKFVEEVKGFSELYSTDMLNAFFAYWSQWDKNRTKMRWEKEQTWERNKRLYTWKNRS